MTVPYFADTRAHAHAADLLARFGAAAADEAAARAERARSLGNHLHFCRWQEVGRFLTLLNGAVVPGTLH